MRLRHFIHVGTLGLLLGVLACEVDENRCYPGDFVACTCADGLPGYAQCLDSGSDYGRCDWCGETPSGVNASSATGTGGGGGGPLQKQFMEACELDEECSTGLCHEFNAKGKLCSQACDGPEDCPFPSPGCNMMGICKAP